MLVKSLVPLLLWLCLPACADDPANSQFQGDGDATTIVPEGLSVTTLPGGSGAFNLTGLTLRRGPDGVELFVALRNDGEGPACSPGITVELLDASGQSLARSVGGLLVQRFYRFSFEGSDVRAACVGPGDVSMLAVPDLPSDLALEEVEQINYWLTYWGNLDGLVPMDGIVIRDVRAVTRTDGVAYTGALENGFDVALPNPSVAVFSINRAGRPLGVARSESSVELTPGGRWEFETGTTSEPGVDQVAFPASGL